jgi:cytosine/adenosine deaminase-related metal-dependent hydrolase
MSSRQIDATFVLDGDGLRPGQRLGLDGGLIASVAPLPAPTAARRLVLPALVNAHDHGRAVRTSSIGSAGRPLEAWLQYLALFPSVDPYLAAAVSLGNSARGGAGVVMMHYTRTQGFTDLPTEAAEVARAARDVGVRVGFAVSMKDRNPVGYGPADALLAELPAPAREEIAGRFFREPMRVADQIALVDAVAAAAEGPLVNVQYGPNGPQWCSDALLEAVAEASARTGRRVHMHLFETRYQRACLDELHGGGVVKFLDRIGLLSPRLTLAHCVWARPDELELLAARGVIVSTNSSSNLKLQSGVAPAADMLACGCALALGIDAGALDDDDDMLRELRLTRLLHAGTGFATRATPLDMLRAATRTGRRSVIHAGGGDIAAGAPADLLLLDYDAIDDDGLRDDLDPVDLLYARACARHMSELIVDGRTVVRDGTVLGLDLDAARREVLAQMRAAMPAQQRLAAALPPLDRAIAVAMERDFRCQ